MGDRRERRAKQEHAYRIELPARHGVRYCLAHGSSAVETRPSLGADTHVGRAAVAAVAAAIAAFTARRFKYIRTERIEVTLPVKWCCDS